MLQSYIQVHFERPDDTVAVGQTLRGEVRVAADLVRRRRRILLKIGYRINGRGTPEGRVVRESMLRIAPDEEGRFRHTFEVPIPESGPISYTDEVVDIQWRVIVEEVRPHRRNKRHVFPFIVTTPQAVHCGDAPPVSAV